MVVNTSRARQACATATLPGPRPKGLTRSTESDHPQLRKIQSDAHENGRTYITDITNSSSIHQQQVGDMKSRTGTRAFLAVRPPLRPATRVLRLPYSKALACPPTLSRHWVAPSSTATKLLRRYATAATQSGSVVGPDPPLAPFLPTPVPGSENLRAVLKDTEKMLLTDVGGSSVWYDRVKAANADLGATRRSRVAGGFLTIKRREDADSSVRRPSCWPN